MSRNKEIEINDYTKRNKNASLSNLSQIASEEDYVILNRKYFSIIQHLQNELIQKEMQIYELKQENDKLKGIK